MLTSKRWFLALAGAMVLAVTAASPANAAPAAEKTDKAETARRCAALVGNRFEGLAEAPTVITSAKIGTNEGAPEYCDISGYVAPQTTITVKLPTEKWNGKLFVTGCGGVCGTPVRPGLFFDNALNRGYAVVGHDMGHHSGGSAGTEGQWAYHNLTAQLDFGFRSSHVATVAGKALVEAFYKKQQARTYHQGCSTGGRQGMIAAQRYPDDYDGIIVGAPVNVYATGSMQQIWASLANRRADHSSIMKRADVLFLHKAVLKHCDAKDGLEDAMIEDPRKCDFDVASVQCKPGQTSECLTEEMVNVARKVYSGPVNSKGEKIHSGAPPVGSELNWISSSFDDGERPGALLTFGMEKLRYISYAEGPNWKATDFNWDLDPARARGFDSVYASSNPDLRKFKARGGKMIQYHGWNDETAVPANSVGYYEMATRTMGGPAKTMDFFRLFMIPGMNHCNGGTAANRVDYLTALENWVEKGQAPDVMLGEHQEQGKVTLTRPHFPYPDVARYRGSGDPNKAESFERITPN